jgi:hypothetical protein
MLRKIAFLLLAFQSSWMVPVAFGTPAPDDLTIKLSRHVTNYNLGVFNFLEALIRVSNDFQIPMGIVWVSTSAARAGLPFAWKEATVREIIEAIAKTQPGYQVEVTNGVVHISPPALIADRENFLTLKIPEFKISNQYTEVVISKLHDFIAPPRTSGFSIGAMIEPKITLELKNSTVEDILDALDVASTRKIWVVTFADDTGLTPSGFRRTRSLWTDAPIPDEEQPALALLHWGDPRPRPSPGTK